MRLQNRFDLGDGSSDGVGKNRDRLCPGNACLNEVDGFSDDVGAQGQDCIDLCAGSCDFIGFRFDLRVRL